MKWLRIIWECKAYVLKPEADHHKDFDDKAYSWFLVGYFGEKIGYEAFVAELNKIVTSVHVIFNEVIPDSTADYFSELERLQVKEDNLERSVVDDLHVLVGQPI